MMQFRNLTLFRFPQALKFDDLEERLREHALKPVGPLQQASRGFVPPFGALGGEDAAYAHGGNDALWLTVGGEDRLLPGTVVAAELAKKIADFEAKNARTPGGKMRRQMKEELVDELLPRAFVRPVRTDAILDLQQHFIIIDTASRKVAEAVVSQLREALGSFPALPLAADIAPRAVLTGWVAGEALPDGVRLGDECELREAGESATSGPVVKLQRMELIGEEIETHLEAGKQATRLSLDFDGHASCVLGDDLVLRKFKLLAGAVDSLEATERDDVRAELDARFALLVAEVRRVMAVLGPALHLSETA